MKLSVSDLLRFKTCNYMHYAATVAGVPSPTGAMRRGTALHKAFEQKLKGEAISLDLSDVDDADKSFVERGIARLQNWTPPFTVHATEHPRSVAIDEHNQIVGRLDGWVEDRVGHWSAQLKTLGKGRNLALTMEKVRMSPHELTYHYLMRPEIELRGTYLVLLKDLTKEDLKNGVDMLTCVALPRSPAEVNHAWNWDIYPKFKRMVQSDNYLKERDWTSCYGEFGNSPCAYYEHCHNGLPLEPGLLNLVPMEDRYPDVKA